MPFHILTVTNVVATAMHTIVVGLESGSVPRIRKRTKKLTIFVNVIYLNYIAL